MQINVNANPTEIKQFEKFLSKEAKASLIITPTADNEVKNVIINLGRSEVRLFDKTTPNVVSNALQNKLSDGFVVVQDSRFWIKALRVILQLILAIRRIVNADDFIFETTFGGTAITVIGKLSANGDVSWSDSFILQKKIVAPAASEGAAKSSAK